jgi:hypothetical protein
MAILSFSTSLEPPAAALTSFFSASAPAAAFFFFIFLSKPDHQLGHKSVWNSLPAETAERTLSLISLLSSRNALSSNLCFFLATSSTSKSASRLLPDEDDSASEEVIPRDRSSPSSLAFSAATA